MAPGDTTVGSTPTRRSRATSWSGSRFEICPPRGTLQWRPRCGSMPRRPLLSDCSSWDELQRTIDKFVRNDPYRWIFRGQAKASWGLVPRIERDREVGDVLKAEDLLLYDFQSKAPAFAERLPGLSDMFAWLSTMQHYGVPTRLLDWTYTAHVALFFALEKRPTKDPANKEEVGTVWAIDSKTLDDTFQERARKLLHVDGRVDSNSFGKIALPPGPTHSVGLVAPFLPNYHVARLSFQQGLFLVNCNWGMTFENSLADMMKVETRDWLQRINFPWSIRTDCLRQLMQLNIHPATLFPDLEGLARILTLKDELFGPQPPSSAAPP